MELIKSLVEDSQLREAKKQLQPATTSRNFVAKHSQSKTGAGAHEDKSGENAKRSRRNRNWKKEAAQDL